jgi:hypothetical protein
MSSDSKIYVDAGQPATLNDGAGRLTDCVTLQEAVLAWHALAGHRQGDWRAGVHGASDRSARATISRATAKQTTARSRPTQPDLRSRAAWI